MNFQGPEPADLAHVQSLNNAFLRYTCHSNERLRGHLPGDLGQRLRAVEPLARARLARSPFLLYSLHESDDSRWEPVFEGRSGDDLLLSAAPADSDATQLVSATLAFLWQFARRNPYAARVVSGASLHWCERLADSTLIELFRHVAVAGDLLTFRLAHRANFWNKLLCAGTSSERGVRSAARMAALQTVLTSGNWRQPPAMRAAACALPAPSMRVADQDSMCNSGRRGYNTPPHESPDNKKSRKDLRQR